MMGASFFSQSVILVTSLLVGVNGRQLNSGEGAQTFYSSADDDFMIAGVDGTSGECALGGNWKRQLEVVSDPAPSSRRKLLSFGDGDGDGNHQAVGGGGMQSGKKWICAIMGATSGKAVSGCSSSGSPKSLNEEGDGQAPTTGGASTSATPAPATFTPAPDPGPVPALAPAAPTPTTCPLGSLKACEGLCNKNFSYQLCTNKCAVHCATDTTTPPPQTTTTGAITTDTTSLMRQLAGAATCGYKGSTVGRIDRGTSNPLGTDALMMKAECHTMLANSMPYVSVGGGDYNPMAQSLVMDCSNPSDDEEMRVYFACCTSTCDCVDPEITGASGSSGTDIATTTATTKTSTTVTAVAASAVGAAVLGMAAVVTARRHANAESEQQQLRAVLAQDGISSL